jgi:hypothetical protein
MSRSDSPVDAALYRAFVGETRERVGVHAVGEHGVAGVDELRLRRVQAEGGGSAVAEGRPADPQDRRVHAPLQTSHVGLVLRPDLLGRLVVPHARRHVVADELDHHHAGLLDGCGARHLVDPVTQRRPAERTDLVGALQVGSCLLDEAVAVDEHRAPRPGRRRRRGRRG